MVWKELTCVYTNALAIFLNFWSTQIQNSLEALNEASLTLDLIDSLKSLLFNIVCWASVQKYRRKENVLHSILFLIYIFRDLRFDLQLTLKLTYGRKLFSNIWNGQQRLGIWKGDALLSSSVWLLKSYLTESLVYL